MLGGILGDGCAMGCGGTFCSIPGSETALGV
jgi:hypothetical protein